MSYLWEESAQLQVHDVIQVELSEALVVIVPEDRRVSDQPPDGQEGLLKAAPHHVLTGIRHLWILLSEERQVSLDAESDKYRTVL